ALVAHETGSKRARVFARRSTPALSRTNFPTHARAVQTAARAGRDSGERLDLGGAVAWWCVHHGRLAARSGALAAVLHVHAAPSRCRARSGERRAASGGGMETLSAAGAGL